MAAAMAGWLRDAALLATSRPLAVDIRQHKSKTCGRARDCPLVMDEAVSVSMSSDNVLPGSALDG